MDLLGALLIGLGNCGNYFCGQRDWWKRSFIADAMVIVGVGLVAAGVK